MKLLAETRISSSFVLVMSLVLGSLPSAGQPVRGRETLDSPPRGPKTLHLTEGASITVIKTSSGDLTARQDSYASAMSQAFSQQKECSTVKVQDSSKTNFLVQFYVAHLLEQYTISYAVVGESGSVVTTGTTNSFGDTAQKVCALIRVPTKETPKQPPQPECSPRGKGKAGACDVDDSHPKRAPRNMSYY